MSRPTCELHPRELAIETCRNCGAECCDECAVPVQNAATNLCLPCALSKAGIRAGGRPRQSWLVRRREARLRKKISASRNSVHDRIAAAAAVEPRTRRLDTPRPAATTSDWASPEWHSER